MIKLNYYDEYLKNEYDLGTFYAKVVRDDKEISDLCNSLSDKYNEKRKQIQDVPLIPPWNKRTAAATIALFVKNSNLFLGLVKYVRFSGDIGIGYMHMR